MNLQRKAPLDLTSTVTKVDDSLGQIEVACEGLHKKVC